MQTPAVCEWDEQGPNLVLVEPDHGEVVTVQSAPASTTAAVATPQPRKKRAVKKPAATSEPVVAPAPRVRLRLGGVTRDGGYIPAPIAPQVPANVSPQPVPKSGVTSLSFEQDGLHLRLSPRALFFTGFSLIWTILAASSLGVL